MRSIYLTVPMASPTATGDRLLEDLCASPRCHHPHWLPIDVQESIDARSTLRHKVGNHGEVLGSM
jgi:hypothetical protein